MLSDDCVYAVGVIKATEEKLLSSADFARIKDLDTAAAIKYLTDKGFGGKNNDKVSAEQLIDLEQKSVWELIDSISPNKDITDLFKIENDAINIKLIIKSMVLNETVVYSELEIGTVEPLLLKRAFEEQIFFDIPQSYREIIEKALVVLSRSEKPNIQAICAEVDTAVYKVIFAKLLEFKDETLNRYFIEKIDYTNLLSLFRGRKLGYNALTFMPLIIEGGNIPREDLVSVLEAPSEIVHERLHGVGYPKDISKILNIYEDEGLSSARIKVEGILGDIIYQERNESFSITPVINYLQAKLAECRKLRSMFAKKRSSNANA